MVINEFNFVTFYQKAFGAYGRMSISKAKALCDHLNAMSWGDLCAFCETQDTSVALISVTNQAYLIATEGHYYLHGEDFAHIDEQIREGELLAQSGQDLSNVPYSLETAWPADTFRKLGMIQGDQQWNGVFLSA